VRSLWLVVFCRANPANRCSKQARLSAVLERRNSWHSVGCCTSAVAATSVPQYDHEGQREAGLPANVQDGEGRSCTTCCALFGAWCSAERLLPFTALLQAIDARAPACLQDGEGRSCLLATAGQLCHMMCRLWLVVFCRACSVHRCSSYSRAAVLGRREVWHHEAVGCCPSAVAATSMPQHEQQRWLVDGRKRGAASASSL
jgi:hypothetical protein